MRLKYFAVVSLLALSGCDQIGQKALNAIPDPSQEQAQVAQAAYDELRTGNFDQLYTYFEPELKAKFVQNEKELRKFARGIPNQEYSRKNIVAKHIEKATDKPSLYTVTYEYGYTNKNLVQYDVSFDKPAGSSKIRDFNISVFGEKN
ncbi:DUF3887 domain-containing protein [Acinetobacter gandensis]|uniref:DUF3887 domain-containing protein n=1 Tax=Acinetobacter gandensis TaxID=1443941 RepID=A0A1A7R8G0_9GAMM|nr:MULTISPECIES: DUF3887 domain-containing protein [Acinetobacter]KAB0626598.1 DUF3887 domain-containing protein [Acinetobacter gandensis]OBX28186.1 DUF3887 domain-containing protein [Acinetobacter gandensis]